MTTVVAVIVDCPVTVTLAMSFPGAAPKFTIAVPAPTGRLGDGW